MSWYEARAFCAWLDSGEIKPHLLRDWGLPAAEGWTIRLPSEAEWELAARWNRTAQMADDRRVPWAGDKSDLAAHCNCNFAGIGSTSAVGIFPGGKDGCGAADLIGNVFEWCVTKWFGNFVDFGEKNLNAMTPEQYNMENNKIDDDAGDERRVLRGGSWLYYGPRSLRCAYRNFNVPGHRYHNVGFRVVCALEGSVRR